MKDYFAQFWGVRADGSNVGQRLQDCLNQAGNEGGGRVVLNDYPSDTTDGVLIDSPIVMPPNVSLESTSDTKVKIRKSTSLTNWFQLSQDNRLHNIDLLSDGNVTNAMVQFLSGFNDCSVVDCDFSNGTETTSSLRMVQMFDGEGGVVEGCVMDRPKWGIQATDDNGAKNIRIKNNTITNVNDDGNHIFLSSIDDIKIQDNKLLAFIDTVKGSHHIQFRSKHTGGVARPPSANVVISGNTVTGVPGVAAISGVDNGGSGDMVVLRNVIGGRVFNNTLRHGGELGIDVVDSSSDVHVYENDIAFIDASGIIVGSSLVLGGSPDNRVENVHVYRNTISDVGLDAAGTIQRMSKSGIRFWNCRRASAYFNEIYRPGSYAISVRANDADAPEYDVEEFSYGLNNCYEMNGEPHFFAGFNPTINEDRASSNFTTAANDGAASWAGASTASVGSNEPPLWAVGNTSPVVRWAVGSRIYTMRLIDDTKDPSINPAARDTANDAAATNGFAHWQLQYDTVPVLHDPDLAGYLWAAAQLSIPMDVVVGFGATKTQHTILLAPTVADYEENPTAADQEAYTQI